ncbi:hypothetical protein [Methylobacterium nodulans]|uniref:Uncharacterized protein n=1 Tax=Methylobacterium nodulans (strain LMG 21967 / CNCM I-2342 / ORS 2060) TaxID=460265 RepID=B8IGH2_METNO|nr:hypothetical protein [Methylobacterium nodulans]ACL55872.1 conserved hypothetical protein [Methylobacterium nodulans ORS 2060]
MSHKFRLHQRVQMVRAGFSDAQAPSGEIYEIVRLMPEDRSGEASYRIRSRMAERAVRESEIAPVR